MEDATADGPLRICAGFIHFILIARRLGQTVTSATANRQLSAADPLPAALAISGDGDRLALAGALEIATLDEARRCLEHRLKQGQLRSLDLANLDGLDTPGALFLCRLRDQGVEITGSAPDTGRCSISSARSTSSRCRKRNPFPAGASWSSRSAKARTMQGTMPPT